MELVIALLVAAVGVIYWYIRKTLNYWADRNVLHEPPVLPWGNLNFRDRNISMVERIKEIYDQFYGKDLFCGIYFTVSPRLLLLDCELIKNVLIKDFNNFRDRGIYTNEKGDPLSYHLFFMEGQPWRNMRTKLSPTFTSGKMKMMYNTMYDVSNVMIKVAETNATSGKSIDAKVFTSRFKLDIIAMAAFGLDLNSLENPQHEMIGYAKQVLDFSGAFKQMKMMFMNTFPTLARMMNVWITPPEFAAYFTKVMSETIAYREENNVVRNDFLNLLLQIKNNGKLDDGENLGKITFNELMAQSTVFLVAGFETSATAMMFALYELAVNPDVQVKLRGNVFEILQKHDGNLTYEAIIDMDYLGYVVTETLRKYPSVPTLFRTTAEDYPVPGRNITIEKGTQIFVPVYAIHHNSEFYPEPEKFKPERWLPEEVQNRPAMSYLTFGDGPRNCIGNRFGLMQIKLGLARLVEKYNILLNSSTSMPLKLDPKDISLGAAGGVYIDLIKMNTY